MPSSICLVCCKARTDHAPGQLCPEHRRDYENGYMALIEALPDPQGRTVVRPEKAQRTGQVMMVHKANLRKLLSPQANLAGPALFIDPDAFAQLKETIETTLARAQAVQQQDAGNNPY